MSVTAAILLFLSAIVHAGWNALSKKEHPTLAFYLVANTIGVLCVLPLLIRYGPGLALVPATVWGQAALSGFLLAAYMAALAGAYRTGDISIAYPIARSLPVFFVTAATMILGLGQSLSGGFMAGVFLIVSGCLMLPLPTFRQLNFHRRWNPSCALSLLAALCIAGYTTVDHEAIVNLRDLPGSPFSPVDAALLYMVLEAISTSVWKGLWVLCSSVERKRFREVMAGFKGSAALTGIGIYLTYGLVLVSMNYVTNVSYVAAFRQLSIPMGALFGMVFLKEPRPAPKLAGLGLIFFGLVAASVT